MSTKSIILTSSGLKNIVINLPEREDEFRFIFGQQEIKMQRIYAEFLSPRVSHLHQIDPTINSLKFLDLISKKTKTKTTQIDTILNESTISAIYQLSRGSQIEVNEDNRKNLLHFSILLGNEELFEQICQQSKEEKTVDEIIEEILFYEEQETQFFERQKKKLVDDLSILFSKEYNQKQKVEIPKRILYLILTNEHFQPSKEDELFEMIEEYISKYKEENEDENEINEIELYERVDYSKLSSSKFSEFICKFDYNKMTGEMWSKLCQRFCTNNKEKEEEEGVHQIEFDGDPNHRFSGIIEYLRGNRKINIADEGIISVTASSTTGTCYPKNVVEFDSNKYFYSDSSCDWLQYDFKDKRIRPTHYSIKTRNNSDIQCPVSWCIEVSNTGGKNDWKIIDSCENVQSVSKRNQSDTFKIKCKISKEESYRYVRLRLTGQTTGNCNNVVISALEYFGALIETNNS